METTFFEIIVRVLTVTDGSHIWMADVIATVADGITTFYRLM